MALDADDLKKIADLIKASVDPIAAKVDPAEVGKVVKAHLDEAKKGFVTAEDLKKREEEAAKARADAEAAAKAKTDEEAAKGKGGKSKDPAEKDPSVAALEAELEKLKKQAADAEAAAKSEREKARTEKLYGSARDALLKHGARSEHVDAAMSRIRDLGLLAYDGDRPGWRGKNEVGLDAVLDIEAQAKAWLGTTEGKLFLPPVGVKGTGEGRGNGAGSGSHGGAEASLESLRSSAGALALGALKAIS